MTDQPSTLPVIHVVAAAIIRKRTCLVGQRAADDSLPGLWEFPGGKVERAEHPEDALHREIEEELGTTIEVLRPAGRGISKTERRTLVLDVYLARLTAPEPSALVHQAVRWVEERELLDLRLAPADLFALDEITREMMKT